MQYGIIVTTGDPRIAAELGAEAEAAGWDGVFSWDGISVGDMDTYDPWVLLAAVAMRTERVRIGAIVTPPARRRPWKLARETMTLDRLSNGRLVLPVGLGATDDAGFGNVGEPVEARVRAERLDESLAILEGLWTGEPFAFEGRHYRFGPMTFRPTPIQHPRIPIWVVGVWPHERSLRRTLRWDGIYLQLPEGEGDLEARAATVVAVAEYAARERSAALRERAATSVGSPWEIIVEGRTPAGDRDAARDYVRPLAQAGATWWIESDWETWSVEETRKRIAAGPPGP